LLNEIANYRYKNSAIDNDERVPDGNDDLLDPLLYGCRYILEDVLNIYPQILKLGKTQEILYNEIKKIA
jgi:hypothetical protein